jgi:hypothetical protein
MQNVSMYAISGNSYMLYFPAAINAPNKEPTIVLIIGLPVKGHVPEAHLPT